MYKVKNNKKNGKIIKKIDFVTLDGFVMPSKKKYFMIAGEKVTDIKIVKNDLIESMISNQVKKKYKKIIKEITDLLVDDDESEGSMNEVLNRIQKFRHEIKKKYHSYLNEKELEKMEKKLSVLEKEAKKNLEAMISYALFDENINTRSK